ncbi:release factor glutamine methyltransferase-like [Tubulanus polymorphus]|uniref:release factor glutamine methyltransferase-like n=1 Tax=Tubulanus polymorphus TaxID=672921 RepID=UPI003DA48F96
MSSDTTHKQLLETVRKLVGEYQNTIIESGGQAELTFCGKKFVTFTDVCFTEGYDDVALNLPDETRKDARVLEIGCGNGCVSTIHYLQNKSKISFILAVDINPQALENTKANFERYGVPGEVRYSDVFQAISEDEKFDFVFWNAPFFSPTHTETGDLKIVERGFIDPGYEGIGRFIAGARKYLRPGGNAYFCFSSACGQIDILEEKAKEAEMRLELFWHKTVVVETFVEDWGLWRILPIDTE